MTTIGDLRHVMVGTISPPSAQLGGLQLPLAHAQVTHANHAHTHVQTSYTHAHAHVHSADLPRINPTLPVNDSTLFAVYCFIKNFIGTSTANTVAIDNKIEQAMDLVKSHLMFAVREEVEVLKEKIAELMDRINQLEYENGLLKTHATPETLAQVSALQAVMSGTTPMQHRPIAQTGGGGSQQ